MSKLIDLQQADKLPPADCTSKLNCWEFKKCGGGPDGANPGTCPTASEQRADGIHDGTNGGRCCWVTAKTAFTSVEEFDTCRRCDFYELVRREEAARFKVTLVILRKMKDKKQQ